MDLAAAIPGISLRTTLPMAVRNAIILAQNALETTSTNAFHAVQIQF